MAESRRTGDYITAEGYETLRRELERLWKLERPRVTREVAAAAAQGDRSENAEYIYGKRRLREIDRRVQFLVERLDALTVVEARPAQEGRVFFGAWVRLADEEGRESVYRLVGRDETDAGRGRISIDSPLGRALLGRRVDDEVSVRRPRGRAVYTVLEISWSSLASE
jgi:transcription elongation factor GreB